jgi:hypothetical protein
MQHQKIAKKNFHCLGENVFNIWHQNVEPASLPQHASFLLNGNLLTKSL